MTADRTHRDVTEKTADRLGRRELDLCRQHRADLVDRALSIGKNPKTADEVGVSRETVNRYKNAFRETMPRSARSSYRDVRKRLPGRPHAVSRSIR